MLARTLTATVSLLLTFQAMISLSKAVTDGDVYPLAPGAAQNLDLLQMACAAAGIFGLVACAFWDRLGRILKELSHKMEVDLSSLSPGWTLFWMSAVSLFLEVLLIRWISVEVRAFTFFKNLALLAAFFGLGAGCMRNEHRINMTQTVAGILVLILLIRIPVAWFFMGLLWSPERFVVWGLNVPTSLRYALGFPMLLAIVTLIAWIFIPLGSIIGASFRRLPNLRAYSINLSGSLLGTLSYTIVSFLETPPWAWFLFTLLALLPLFKRGGALVAATLSLAALAILLRPDPEYERILWSPYQKIALTKGGPGPADEPAYTITVNNAFMYLNDLSPRVLKKLPDGYESVRFNHYDLPYEFHPEAKTALILGAGGGNDAAAALRHSIDRVDAVEIDPAIYRLGREFHPEKPYLSPKCNVIIDDARAYLKRCTTRYDIVTFGLLDSHTLSSAMTNLRLDHFVYTLEAFRDAKKVLAEDGVMVVTVVFQSDNSIARFHGLLSEAFGRPPLVLREGRYPGVTGVVFVAGSHERLQQALGKNVALAEYVEANRVREIGAAPITTDDWPYLYLERPRIPGLYLVVSALLVAAFGVLGRRTVGKISIKWPFFFLGAAFLLLEFQLITRLNLLFGSTWLVNCGVISALLLMALLANIVAGRVPRWLIWPCYGLLLSSLAGNYLIPADAYLGLGHIFGGLLAAFVGSLPVLFAGVIFSRLFRDSEDPHSALGSNLFGATIGGLLETVSFLTGLKALTFLVMAFYALSWICARRSGTNIRREQSATIA